MIRVNQIKLSINHTGQDLKDALYKALKRASGLSCDIVSLRIAKKSIDARNKAELKFSYSVEAELKQEETFLRRNRNKDIFRVEPILYSYGLNDAKKSREGNHNPMRKPLTGRPVVVGSGPAGLFCAYQLALHGYAPILLERGQPVDQRLRDVQAFWDGEPLLPDSNVQFGEGGAGTFSDGKLNTMVRDTKGRIPYIFETFVKHGAAKEITFLNKPHIGTDRLVHVVKGMREFILCHGGEILFGKKVSNLIVNQNMGNLTVQGVELNGLEKLASEIVVLAIGHSARDTFHMLYESRVPMEAKAFAMGVRVEHPQDLISLSQYGEAYLKLPPADYKLTHTCLNGRGVYSFCMCPGGFVINASSEEGALVVNGMSNYNRDEKNANSAIVVTVKPEDFKGDSSPLAGMRFQKDLEHLAYKAGHGKIPVQRFGDFIASKASTCFGLVKPNTKGGYAFADLKACLPDFIAASIEEGMLAFDRKIKDFANEDVLMLGVETRTSSPVRILRNEFLESEIKGLYPCGEGAGYAGGITSAALDGLRVSEAILDRYLPYI